MTRLFIICLLSILLFSCEETVDFPIPQTEQKLVILSDFSAGKPLKVTVTRSESLLSSDTNFVAISNAEVNLYQDNNLLETLTFVQQAPPEGLFFQTNNFQAALGTTYELRVRAPGMPMVKATSSLPKPVALKNVNLRNIDKVTTFQGDRATYNYTLDLVIQDPLPIGNRYHLFIRQQKLAMAEGDGRPTEASNEQPIITAINRATTDVESYHRGGFLFDDRDHNGQELHYTFQIQTTTSSANEKLGKLFVELRTVSEDYYLFNQSISNAFQSSGEPVDQPVIIYTNVENGYGIFAGYSMVKDSLIIVQ